MTNHVLYHRLLPVVRRIRFRRTMFFLSLLWFGFAIVALGLTVLNHNQQLDTRQFWLPVVLVMTFSTVLVAWWARRPSDFEYAVNHLEGQFPDLDSTLLTAMEQQSQTGQPLGFLQQDVLRQAVNHSFANPWTSLVPGWQLFAMPLLGLLGLAAFAGSTFLMTWYARPLLVQPTVPFAEVVVENVDYEIAVEPGNAEVELGGSLMVLARFGDVIPPDAALVYRIGEDELVNRPMTKSLDDPVFGARIPTIRNPLKYWVEFADQKSDEFDITVFEFPELVRADARLEFPTYTQLENKVIQDVSRLSAVQGTEIEFEFYVNKSPVDARLVSLPRADEPSIEIGLVADTEDPCKYLGRLNLTSSVKLELRLRDNDGRRNRVPPQITLTMLENQLPDLKLTSPRRDVEVSAIEELQLAATAWDDFGINSLGLVYAIAGTDQQELVLLKDGAAKKKHAIDHLLELEKLDAQPDQLMSYHFWAEDIGPDGQLRRVESDMYFAEVRHFEEIFRQGQAPPGGQPNQQSGQNSQNAQQAQELAELQKQIINATWKLIRRETGSTPTKSLAEDTKLVGDSQATALDQLSELAKNLKDGSSRQFVEQAAAAMNEAIVHLKDAVANAKPTTLRDALASEQLAYQGLLKLRAREHSVVQSQQSQQGQGQPSGNRAQQQLQQLDLKQDENRYETERTATDPQQSETREDRQVLSRLRELARRQDDLNDRIKELQSALEKAETQEEKDEIEKRLKSLREQQEQLLRDTDELLDRMQQPENQRRMSEQSQQLEKARENIREASEALEKGQVSRAAADGTRAQRELEELRDEFQDRAAGQFDETMRQMRNEAQELEQKQQEIRESLEKNELNRTGEPGSLDLDESTPDVQEQLERQADRVQQLRQSMRQTIEEAESFEPLLAEQLYETYRKSEVDRPDRALQSARDSFRRGWTEDAKLEEQKAQAGIEKMRVGIESAAESILGDETDALREAEQTLEELNQQLRENLRSGRPNQQESAGQDNAEAGGQPDQDQQNGDSQNDRPDRAPQRGGAGDSEAQETEPNADPRERRPSAAASSEEGSSQQSDQQVDDNPNASQRRGSQSSSNSDRQQTGESSTPGNQGGRSEQREGQPSDGRNRERQLRSLDGQQPDGGGMRSPTGAGNQRTMREVFGEDFRQWSDQLRDVEEMMADPDLRSEAARIREEAKEIRREAVRHSVPPNWELVELKVSKPLMELRDRVSEELLRRTSDEARVPLDREPIPTQYQDAVRSYFERIGSGE